MSKYPAWWSNTLTIYNKYVDGTTHAITWYKHTVHNCFWKYTGAKVTIGETVIETDTSLCRIPEDKMYREPWVWDELSSADKLKYFTLSVGDIIVNGAVTDTIDEYRTGERSTDLIGKYKDLQGCIVVERCANNTGYGRGMKHYYVRGL